MKRVGRYELMNELGRGGMGVVFRGRDTVLGRNVAVKLLATSFGPRSRERLRREARVVARMDHPGIVPVFDLGESEQEVFLVMPLVDGRTLRDALASGPLSVEQTVEVARQVALALDYSHERGIVHRDVKPENVMLVDTAGGLRVQVMDFGIAISPEDEGVDGRIVGTPHYLSPEQAQGERVDRRADVYALGAVIFECLAGRPPFEADAFVPLVTAIVANPAPRVQSLVPTVPDWLDGLVSRCLAKEARRRPQTAREVVDALSSASSESVPVRRGSRLRGRSDVLRVLGQRLRRARSGEAQLVFIGGELGVGKTTLVEALHEVAEARGFRTLVGRSFDREDSVPYHGFRDAIATFLERHAEGDNPLEPLLPELVEVFPSLERKVSDTCATLDAEPFASRATEARSHVRELLARTLIAMADGEPLVLALEDVAGGDVTIDALHYLHRRLADMPVLIVASYDRLALDEASPLRRLLTAIRRDPRALRLELGPLAPGAQRRILEDVLGAPVAEATATALHELSGGHPLYLQLAAREMMDAGALQLVDGRWQGSDLALVPDSLRELINARLARLNEGTRSQVEAASVLGAFFTTAELAALTTRTVDLEPASSLGLIREARRAPRVGYSFANEMTRLVLYTGLDDTRRRALHERAAQALLRDHGEDPTHAAMLAHHHRRAGLHQGALRFGVIAAHQALESQSPEEALRFLELLSELDPAEVSDPRLLLTGWSLRIEAHRLRREEQDALADVEKALEIAAALDDAPQVAELLATAAELELELGDVELALTHAREALSRTTIEGPTRLRLHRVVEMAGTGDRPRSTSRPPPRAEPASQVDGVLLLAQGDYLAAVDAFEQAIGALPEGERLPPVEEARLRLRRARLAMSLARYAECESECDAALDALGTESATLRAEVLACLSLCHTNAGRFEEAHHVGRRGVTLIAMAFDVERNERERVLALLLRSIGNMLLGRGRTREAIDAFANGLALCETGADLWERSVARYNLGEACVTAGDLDAGVTHLERAREEKLELGDDWGLAYVHHALASVALERGDLTVAHAHAEEGSELARRSGDPKPVVMHRVLAGRIARLEGRDDAALQTLRFALRQAERFPARPEILAARLELSALALSRRQVIKALEHAEVARACGFDWGSSGDRAKALLAVGRVLGSDERTEQAAVVLAEALGYAETYGNPHREREVREAIAQLPARDA